MITKTYDPSKINITFLGVIITDFADGDFVSVTFPERFTPVEGADGSENRINTGKKGCDVTITIQRASSTNDLLSALHITDAATNTGKGSLSIKDLNGTSLLFSAQAYIKKFADSADGNSMGTRAWEIRAPFATVNIGGNL
jgi:hypothetical protein